MKKAWMQNGVEFSSEPYPWKGNMFFVVSTGGGLESIFVEEGSTVWAHYEKEDYRMIAGEDDKWVNKCDKNHQSTKDFQTKPKTNITRREVANAKVGRRRWRSVNIHAQNP